MRRPLLIAFLCALALFVAPAAWANPGDFPLLPASRPVSTPLGHVDRTRALGVAIVLRLISWQTSLYASCATT